MQSPLYKITKFAYKFAFFVYKICIYQIKVVILHRQTKKIFRTMKNETKKKIAVVSAGFTLTTFIGTFLLVIFNHPAQWYIAGACMFGMIMTFVFSCSIED